MAIFDAEGEALNNISLLLRAVSLPIQDFWNACRALELQLDLDNATGAWLDYRGLLVGEDRNGLSDDIYRRRIRARIAVHRSTCTTEDLIRIADLIVFDPAANYVILTPSGGTVVVRVDGVSVTGAIAAVAQSFLQKAAGTGIRLIFQYTSASSTTRFRFDSGPGFDNGQLDNQIG